MSDGDREHIHSLNPQEVETLRQWLYRPNGALSFGPAHGLSFEAVEGGGILVRTMPYVYIPPKDR